MTPIRWSELRLSIRLLRQQPGLAVLAILGTAIAIGTVVATSAIVRGVFLAPLPVPGGERLVFVWDQHRTRGHNVYIGSEEFTYRRAHATAFEDLAAFESRTVLVDVQGGPSGTVRAASVTPNTFSLFAIPAARGRGLVDADSRPGADPVVVISHDVWQARLGGRDDVLGTELRISGEPRTIVGVMPARVRFPIREDLWIPAAFTGSSHAASRLMVFGRLRPGVTRAQAEDQLAGLVAGRATLDNQLADLTQRVIPFTRGIGGPEQTTVLLAIAGVLGLLLAVAAANVANLILARNGARLGEMAVRAALGASRGVLVRLLLLEAFVISALGGAIGLAGARAGLRWFEAATATASDLPWWADMRVNPIVLAILVATTFLITLAIGIGPALHVTRAPLSQALRRHSGQIAGVRFGRVSAAMVVAEFAIAVAFIGAASTIGRGLLSFSFTDYDLPVNEVLVSQIYFGPAHVSADATADARRRAWRRHYDDSIQRLRRIEAALRTHPTVRTVSIASAFPGNEVTPAQVEIDVAGAARTARVIEIGEHYFDVLQTRLTLGRDFLPAEHTGLLPVAIVNEPFARKYLGGVYPIGHRVRVHEEGAPSSEQWRAIVGVVRDLGVNPGDANRADAVYVPISPTSVARLGVRTSTDPSALTATVHEIAQREAPAAHVQWTVTLASQLAEVVAVFQRIGTLLVAAGALALLLSAASLYAIVSLTVTQRTREIGIRVALGASARHVLQVVMRREVRQLAMGAMLGVAGAAALMQAIKQIPFDIRPAGFALTGGFVVMMLVAGLTACALPARRALRVDPVESLRRE